MADLENCFLFLIVSHPHPSLFSSTIFTFGSFSSSSLYPSFFFLSLFLNQILGSPLLVLLCFTYPGHFFLIFNLLTILKMLIFAVSFYYVNLKIDLDLFLG